jgi:hypothetical protein
MSDRDHQRRHHTAILDTTFTKDPRPIKFIMVGIAAIRPVWDMLRFWHRPVILHRALRLWRRYKRRQISAEEEACFRASLS